METEQLWATGGTPLGAIHVAAAADDCERFAASELQRCLKVISGAELPVIEQLGKRQGPAILLLNASRPSQRKHVGDCPIDALRDDGYAIHSVGEDLVITSHAPFGIVHGCYQYLVRVLGAYFPDLGPEGEVLPRLDRLAHPPVALLKNPTLRYRGMQMAYSSRRLNWMAQNGFNWVRMGNDNDLEWWDRKLQELTPEYRRRGIGITFGHHSFHMILPLKRYGADNPEYFDDVDGQPTSRGQFHWSPQNRDAMDEVIWRTDWFLRRHPEIAQFDFWPSDGIGEIDTEDYRAMTGEEMPEDWPDKDKVAGSSATARLGDPRKARLYAMMARDVATALATKHPNVQFVITAYADLAQPCPLTPLPKNVTCTIAMYWRCYRHSIFDEGCIYNDQYRQIVREWTEMYPDRDTYLSEYYMGMGIHVSLPYPIITTIFREWPGLRALGVTGAKVNTGREVDRCAVPYNINYLAFQSIVWGDHADADAFLTHHCKRTFDNAWEPMLGMFRLWEQRLQEAEHTQPGYHSLHWFFDEKTIESSRQWLLEAQRQTRNPLVLNRVSRLLMLVNYTGKALEVGDLPERYEAARRAGDDVTDMERQLLPWLARMAEEFWRLQQLDLDVVGFVGPTEHMTATEQRQKRNRWEVDLARMRKADWVKDEFDPDILRNRPT